MSDACRGAKQGSKSLGPPSVLIQPLRHQPLVSQCMLQCLVTRLRQHLLPNLHSRLTLLAIVLLFRLLGSLLILLHIDVMVRDPQMVQMSARPLRIPTPIGPVDFNRTHVFLLSIPSVLMDNLTSNNPRIRSHPL